MAKKSYSVWSDVKNPYHRIVNKWSKSRIKSALVLFSYGVGCNPSRRAKRDYKILRHLPRFQLNKLQKKHRVVYKTNESKDLERYSLESSFRYSEQLFGHCYHGMVAVPQVSPFLICGTFA